MIKTWIEKSSCYADIVLIIAGGKKCVFRAEENAFASAVRFLSKGVVKFLSRNVVKFLKKLL